MAWNEPENGDKDPWKRRKPDGADELEESIRKFKARLSGFFTGGKQPSSDTGNSDMQFGAFGIGFVVVVLLILWALSGIYIVHPAEQAVVLRFGQFHRVETPGPHWLARFIDARYIVNVEQMNAYSYAANMLTKDENIISVEVAVQYLIGDPESYLFNVNNPEMSLKQATASALRQVIGRTSLERALTTGRETVRQKVQEQLTLLLKRYKTGLDIDKLVLQTVKAPDEVKAAFDDAINAQEDEKRFRENADRDAQKKVQSADGRARRILTEANAYQKRVILSAKADIARFLALLPQAHRAPKVTRDRLYFDAMESVLAHSTKLLVDTKGSNNMFYLPLDQLTKASAQPVNTVQAYRPLAKSKVSQASNYLTAGRERRTDRPDRSHIIES